jgi:hypothetical protein
LDHPEVFCHRADDRKNPGSMIPKEFIDMVKKE